MARETKYNVDVPSIPEDEPIILFRAQDKLVPALLHYYADLCADGGSPLSHLAEIASKRTAVIDWQTKNSDKVKIPD